MWAAHLCLGLLHHLIVRIHQQLLTALQLCVGVLRLPEASIFVAHVRRMGRDPRRKVQVQALRNTITGYNQAGSTLYTRQTADKLANANRQQRS